MENLPQDGFGLVVIVSPAVALAIVALLAKLAWTYHVRSRRSDTGETSESRDTKLEP